MKLNWITFKGMFAESPLWKKVILFIFLLIFCTVTLTSLSMLISHVAGWNPNSIEDLKVKQLMCSSGMFILGPALFVYLTKKEPADYCLLKLVDPRIIFLSILAICTVYPFISVTASWNEGMHLPEALQGVERWMKESEELLKDTTLQMLESSSIPQLIFNLIVIALIPAIGEELTFRGVIQQSLAKHLKNEHVAVWLAATLFSAIHLQFFGFFPRLLLGVLLGYIFLYGKSLIASIFCHFMNNAIIIIYAYVSDPKTALDSESSLNMTHGTIAASVLLLVVTFFILSWINHINNKAESKKSEK